MLLKHVGHEDPTWFFFLVNPDILKSFFMIETLNFVVLLHLTNSLWESLQPLNPSVTFCEFKLSLVFWFKDLMEEFRRKRHLTGNLLKKEVGGHVYTRVKAAMLFFIAKGQKFRWRVRLSFLQPGSCSCDIPDTGIKL